MKYLKIVTLISDLAAFSLALYYAHKGDTALTVFYSTQTVVLYLKLNEK